MRLNGPSRTATHMDNTEERRQLSSRAAPWCRTGAAARTTRGRARDGQFAMRRGGGELGSGPGSSSQFYPDPAPRPQPGMEGCCLVLGCPPQPSPAALFPACTSTMSPAAPPPPHIRSVSNIHRCNHCNTDAGAGCRLSSLFTVQQVTGDNISVVTAITQTSPQHSR